MSALAKRDRDVACPSAAPAIAGRGSAGLAGGAVRGKMAFRPANEAGKMEEVIISHIFFHGLLLTLAHIILENGF